MNHFTVASRIGAAFRIVRAAIAIGLAAYGPAVALAQSATNVGPAAKVFDLAISKGRLVNKDETIRVKRGDHVELRWTADRATTLHLHGYDIERHVAPQSPMVMAFRAEVAGRFPVSEHRQGTRHERPVLYLEVHP